jgi:hypothetical protein
LAGELVRGEVWSKDRQTDRQPARKPMGEGGPQRDERAEGELETWGHAGNTIRK